MHSLDADTSTATPDAWLAGQDESLAMRQVRRHAQHKGSFGDVAVVGGAPGMTGAALLAARAALAAGAGRVFVNLLDGGSVAYDALRPELMFRPDWTAGAAPSTLAGSTVVCGCGGGEAVREVLPRLLGRAMRLVLDADALNAIATDPALQTLLIARQDAGRSTVLTPHPLEASRLLDQPTSAVQADRLAAAEQLTQRFGCVVLLKGSGTVVAAPGHPSSINPTGNASLATAGTGDVLSGWLGGLWAQAVGARRTDTDDSAALAVAPSSVAFRAAVGAAFIHGAAADAESPSPLRASDLIDAMQRVGQGGPRR
jgi:hydroxyethylthiazole kinase-like uncharacterized protein yjeF